MKIEIGKKYKTRNGNVTIHRIAFNKVYGVIECAYKDGLFTVWDMGGKPIESEMYGLYDGSLDLVEVKEDFEVIIDYFLKSDEVIMIINNCSVYACVGASHTSSKGILSVKLLFDGGSIQDVSVFASELKLATLDDCKKFILEK